MENSNVTLLSPEGTDPRRPPRPAPPAPLQVTILEAARLMSYDESTIRRLIKKGELVSVGRGRMRRVDMGSLHEYQKRNRS